MQALLHTIMPNSPSGVQPVNKNPRQAKRLSHKLQTIEFLTICGGLQTVEVAPGDPHLFWSASEDGTVRQFDLRLSNQREYESPNVLLTTHKNSGPSELLAAKLNKVGRAEVLTCKALNCQEHLYDTCDLGNLCMMRRL